MRITCAPPAFSAPVGTSRPSACSVAAGRASPSENSTGARSGALISCAAETATRQSVASTSATALGRVSSPRAGNTAWATAAASAIGVGAADPRRVLRGEGREAEIGRRLLVVALLAEHRSVLRRSPVRGVSAAVSATASAPREQEPQKQR